MSAVDFMEEDRDVRSQKLVLCSLIVKWSMHVIVSWAQILVQPEQMLLRRYNVRVFTRHRRRCINQVKTVSLEKILSDLSATRFAEL